MVSETKSGIAVAPEKFIGANVHVTITDSRIFRGILTVIDPFGNLLLSNTYEISRNKFDLEKKHVREIGLVSVPRATIASIKVDKKTYKNIYNME